MCGYFSTQNIENQTWNPVINGVCVYIKYQHIWDSLYQVDQIKLDNNFIGCLLGITYEKIGNKFFLKNYYYI